MSKFKKEAIIGFLWTFFGVAGGHVIRLGSNLILTRLLFPEMFGVMAVVNAIVTGVIMFSDIGLREGVLHSPRAGQAAFMNTAWTMQIIRGCLIYAVIAACAYPLEAFYGIDNLAHFLMVAALSSLALSFMPTKIIMQEKKLSLKRIVAFEVSSQFVGVVVMVVLAAIYGSIWALVAGTVVTALLKLVLMTVGIQGQLNRFAFEPAAALELWLFGRWIFLSTAAVFLVSQGDRLFLGKILTLEMLGVYSIAVVFSMLIGETAEVIAVKFLSPLYRKFKDSDSDFYTSIKRIRRLGLLGGGIVCLGMTQLGDVLVTSLYDERYAAAGPLLQVMSFGALYRLFDATLRPLFMVFRDSFGAMVYQGLKGVLYVGGMVIGWHIGQGEGLLAAIAFTPLAAYLFMLLMLKKHGYSAWFEELGGIVLLLLIIVGAWFVFDTFPLHAAAFLSP